jgi:hypothetical protein
MKKHEFNMMRLRENWLILRNNYLLITKTRLGAGRPQRILSVKRTSAEIAKCLNDKQRIKVQKECERTLAMGGRNK